MASAPGAYGFVALHVLSGVVEFAIWQHDATKNADDFGNPVSFGQYTEDSATRSLQRALGDVQRWA
jgi:hypothetical protein